MNALLNIIEDADIASLIGLIAILGCVGRNMAAHSPAILRRGWRCAAAAFVAYGLYRSCQSPAPDARDCFAIALRGLLAAGLAAGLGWIGFSILTYIAGFVWQWARTLITVPPVAQPLPEPPRTVYVNRPVAVPAHRPSVTDLEVELHRQLAALEKLALPPDEYATAKDTLTMDFLRKVEALNQRTARELKHVPNTPAPR